MVGERASALAAHESNRAKTEVLARWSHDLRTPLSAVLGFSQLLAQRDADSLNAAQRDDLSRIDTAARHLLRLVNDVLDLATLETQAMKVDLEPVDLAERARAAMDLTRHAAEHAGVTVEPLSLELGAPSWALADRTRVLQALTNLLDNAVKHNHPGGRVRLELQCDDPQRRVRLCVIDTGPGIHADDLPRLFEPFERLGARARGVPGSGLGLATTRRLLERMGGTVGVASTPGVGSRFWLDLAASEPPVEPAGPLPLGTLPPLRSAERIVSPVWRVVNVEDDATNRILLHAMLRQVGTFELTSFASATEALLNAPDADLWIIDRHLPDIDGLVLLERLRQRMGTVRAVLFSADALPGTRDAALAAGFQTVWVKPMQLDELRHALSQLMAEPPRKRDETPATAHGRTTGRASAVS
jgi:CheY-like chemotaxis protein/anti-sigma regulatory factor (Ser/Thr protein kinase)